MFKLQNLIKSIKFIYYLARFNQDNYPKVKIQNDSYVGLDNNKIPLKILTRFQKQDNDVIILFPGASADGEEHPGMLFLGSIICRLGYKVIIPRIPPLKELKLNQECFDWFAHAYSKIIVRDDINSKKVSTMAVSFGGAILLKASIDSRISNNPPKSMMTFGTYSNIRSTLKFLCNGKIHLENKSYNIKPHSWGLTVLFHNFLDQLNFKQINHCKEDISKIIDLKIQDKHDEVNLKINELPDNEAKDFIKNIFDSNIDEKVANEIYRVIDQEKDFIKVMSPKFWSDKIKIKTFIMHGSNDSMVPFTESINLNRYIPNSSLFVSYMYEHKEISTNRGILFKIKEFYKMYSFFKEYFKYNEN